VEVIKKNYLKQMLSA